MTDKLTDNFDNNYHQFLEEALETGCVWGLEGPDGWALCASVKNDDITVMPLWSQPEYAQEHNSGDWQAYEAIPIAVAELLDDWLPGMHEDVIMVGPNWDEDLQGLEVEPLDLLEALEEILQE